MAKIDGFTDEVATHYTGPSFEVTIDRDPTTPNTTKNGLAYRGLFSALCGIHQLQGARELHAFQEAFRLCEADGPGCYNRNPGGSDVLNAHDDLMYGAFGSHYIELDRYVARAILNYGEGNHGVWDNVTPHHLDLQDFKGFQARHPQLFPFLKLCAGRELSFVEKLDLFACVECASFSSESDVIITWMQVKLIERFFPQGWGKKVTNHWRVRLATHYRGMMPEVAANYFKNGHPLGWESIWQDV